MAEWLKASEENREIIKSLVSKVAQVINIPFTVGGGVKTLQHARDILLNGADKVAINTGAVKNPKIITELMELFGRQCIVVAVDVKRNYNIAGQKNVFTDNGKKFWFEVFIYGGKKETGIDAIEWTKKMESLGAGEILLTSIDMDGTKDGYDIDSNKESLERTLSTGNSWFWSRSRKKLWMKGEESGNTQKVRKVLVDCDSDALIYLVEPEGPACHTGERTCFHNSLKS